MQPAVLVWRSLSRVQTTMSCGATEWEDLLIQHGILKGPVSPAEEVPEVVYEVAGGRGSDSLDELDDAEFLEQYRYARARFGSVLTVAGPRDWVRWGSRQAMGSAG